MGDQLKKAAITSGSFRWAAVLPFTEQQSHKKKKQWYKSKIQEIMGDSKKLWRTRNDVMRKDKVNKTPLFIGGFITKPQDIANYFNNHFKSKVDTIRKERQAACIIN